MVSDCQQHSDWPIDLILSFVCVRVFVLVLVRVCVCVCVRVRGVLQVHDYTPIC